jgi:hypothetical protein
VLVDTEWVNDTDFELGTTIVLGHFKGRKEASPQNAHYQGYLRALRVGWFVLYREDPARPIPRFIIL